jgi:hypothetical protein
MVVMDPRFRGDDKNDRDNKKTEMIKNTKIIKG